jgi:hypothetical protein
MFGSTPSSLHAGLAGATFLALTSLVIPSFAHDALPTAARPQGWSYPFSCCSGYDCREVTSNGAQKCGIEKTKNKMVGRGVFLVVAGALGKEMAVVAHRLTRQLDRIGVEGQDDGPQGVFLLGGEGFCSGEDATTREMDQPFDLDVHAVPVERRFREEVDKRCHRFSGFGRAEDLSCAHRGGRAGAAAQSFVATALGVTFIFGTYASTSTSRASASYAARSSARHDSHGP